MSDTIITASGDSIADEAVEQFQAGLRGPLLRPGNDAYGPARKLWNGMFDRKPALIARCSGAADVITAVNFARDHGLHVAGRGGGHSIPGHSVCDGGLLIDLSTMKGIRVDPAARRARAEPGVKWIDFDHETQAFGLATSGGTVSDTGIAGLTLGGGLGWLSSKHGLTVDNFVSADVVTADGRLVTANAAENPDLFWALRGGGGNFGIVTSFAFRLHPVSTVWAGPTLYPLEQTAEVLRWYREFLPKAPEDLNGFFALITVPPAPMFPEELHLRKMCGVVWCYSGPEEGAEEAFRPVREAITPALDGVGPVPYPGLQSVFNDLYPPGLQWYWRADFV